VCSGSRQNSGGHLRACPGEPLFGTTPLTDYDPQSVMHYFCGGVGSDQLAITDVDRAGAVRLYGSPRSAFEFVTV
jgi:hypothetical protein